MKKPISIKGYVPPKKKNVPEAPDLLGSLESVVSMAGRLESLEARVVQTVDNKVEEVDNSISKLEGMKEQVLAKTEEALACLEEYKEDAIEILREVKQGEKGENGRDGRDGKDAKAIDEEKLIKRVIAKIPENKASLKIIQEKFEVDPLSVIDRIMALPEEKLSKLRLKSGNIDGLEQTIRAFHNQLGGGRGYLHGGGLSTVSHDGTLTGLGTSASPLSVVLSGVSPLTTKGDLFTYSTSNARLPIGTDNQILIASSLAATGNSWSDVKTINGVSLIGSGNIVIDATVTLNDISANSTTTPVSLYQMTSAVDVEFRASNAQTLFYINEASKIVRVGAEYTSNQFQAISSTFPVAKIVRTTTETAISRSSFGSVHQTSGDMVDGFGTDFSFLIQDSSGVLNEIANFGAVREGADNRGALLFYTRPGTRTQQMRIADGGNVKIESVAGSSDSEVTPRKLTVVSATDASVFIRRDTVTTGNYAELLMNTSTTTDIYGTSIRSQRVANGFQDLLFMGQQTAGSAYATLYEMARFTNTGNWGLGTGATVSAKAHIIATSEQLRIGYDANKAFSFSVRSSGDTTFNPIDNPIPGAPGYGLEIYSGLGGTSGGSNGNLALRTFNITSASPAAGIGAGAIYNITGNLTVQGTDTVAGTTFAINAAEMGGGSAFGSGSTFSLGDVSMVDSTDYVSARGGGFGIVTGAIYDQTTGEYAIGSNMSLGGGYFDGTNWNAGNIELRIGNISASNPVPGYLIFGDSDGAEFGKFDGQTNKFSIGGSSTPSFRTDFNGILLVELGDVRQQVNQTRLVIDDASTQITAYAINYALRDTITNQDMIIADGSSFRVQIGDPATAINGMSFDVNPAGLETRAKILTYDFFIEGSGGGNVLRANGTTFRTQIGDIGNVINNIQLDVNPDGEEIRGIIKDGNFVIEGSNSGDLIRGNGSLHQIKIGDVELVTSGVFLDVDNDIREITAELGSSGKFRASFNGNNLILADANDLLVRIGDIGGASSGIVLSVENSSQVASLVNGSFEILQNTLGSKAFRVESDATNDDPNVTWQQNRVATTDATVTTLHTYAIPASTTVKVHVEIVARRTGGASGTAEDGAAYIIEGCYKNVAGTATIIGALATPFTAESQAGWDATITVTAGNILVRVTGAAANNITWHLSKFETSIVST